MDQKRSRIAKARLLFRRPNPQVTEHAGPAQVAVVEMQCLPVGDKAGVTMSTLQQ